MPVYIGSKKPVGEDRHIFVNGHQVYNDEGIGKQGLRSDTLDGYHIDEIVAGISNGTYRLELLTTTGNVFSPANRVITIYVKLYHGSEDITDAVPDANYVWTRTSSNPGDDLVWNGLHVTGKTIEVAYNNVARGNVLFTCTVYQ